MTRFRELSHELQLKVRLIEQTAKEKGKEAPETKELWNELQKEPSICGALITNKQAGTFKACLRPPAEDRKRCGLHGGKTLRGNELTPAQKKAQMENLRPDARMIHGLYAEESTFIKSLTEEELEYMAYLEETIRSQYEVEEGLGDLILESMLHDAIVHFRMINSGTLLKPSKHTAKPLQDLMKTAKEMGWTKRSQSNKDTGTVLGGLLDKLDEFL